METIEKIKLMIKLSPYERILLVMIATANKRELTLKELSSWTGMTQIAIGRKLDKLERLKLLKIERNNFDESGNRLGDKYYSLY